MPREHKLKGLEMAEEHRRQAPLNRTAAAGFLSNNFKKTVTNQNKNKIK